MNAKVFLGGIFFLSMSALLFCYGIARLAELCINLSVWLKERNRCGSHTKEGWGILVDKDADRLVASGRYIDYPYEKLRIKDFFIFLLTLVCGFVFYFFFWGYLFG